MNKKYFDNILPTFQQSLSRVVLLTKLRELAKLLAPAVEEIV